MVPTWTEVRPSQFDAILEKCGGDRHLRISAHREAETDKQRKGQEEKHSAIV
jgi:hypothetical protein